MNYEGARRICSCRVPTLPSDHETTISINVSMKVERERKDKAKEDDNDLERGTNQEDWASEE